MKFIPFAARRRPDFSLTPLAPQTADFVLDRAGQPLADETRRDMEDIFDADFSDVRVHVGTEADALGALAFAWGSHLFFAPGTYRPETRAGRHLLAHELTHVLQQREGRAGATRGAGPRVVIDPVLEAEAEQMGRRAANFCADRMAPPRRRSNLAIDPSSTPPIGGIIQPAIYIDSGDGERFYDVSNLQDLLTAVKVALKATYFKDKVAREEEFKELIAKKLSTVGAREIYKFATMERLAKWLVHLWEPTPTPNRFEPEYVFDEKHGKLHFIPTPTDKKSAWDLSDANAHALMIAEMNKHLTRLFQDSSIDPVNPWTPWYVCGIHTADLGRYKGGAKGGNKTDRFTIQLQVNVRQNHITYHGFPDEEVKKAGVGTTKSSVA